MTRCQTGKSLLGAAVLIAAIGNATALAHSRGMGTLDIHGRGSRLLLTWVFYYDELPAQLALPDGSGQKVSLSDPREIKEGLGRVGAAAFQVKLGKQILPPPSISRILVLPDKTCLIILSYPLQGDGPVEVRAPVLRLFPPNYLLNVRFPGAGGKIGSTLMDGTSAPLDALVAEGGMGSADGARLEAGNPFWTGFKMELGTAWLHTDWILLGALLLVLYPVRRAFPLLLGVIVLRAILVYLAFKFAGFPFRVPAFLLCLPLVLLAASAGESRVKGILVTVATIGAGLTYTAYDLQFLPVGEKGEGLAGLAGYQSGFMAGYLSALGVMALIGVELNRSIPFQSEAWRRKVGWAVVAISLWISVYSLVAK